MRQITNMVFLGNEGSRTEIANLHLRLDTALMTLSGLQQPDRAKDENHYKLLLEARIKCEQELQDMVSDLVAAFGFDPSDLTFKKLSHKP